MRRIMVLVASAGLLAACTSSDAGGVRVVERVDNDPTTSVVVGPATTDVPNSTTSTEVAALPSTTEAFDGSYVVESLGISFLLEESFEYEDDPTYQFFARSNRPPALITIMDAGDDIADYESRPGETVSELDLGVSKAVTVTDAALDGLPQGISANELLVSNGSRSFSVIMSGVSSALPELWATFIDSLVVAPRG